MTKKSRQTVIGHRVLNFKYLDFCDSMVDTIVDPVDRILYLDR